MPELSTLLHLIVSSNLFNTLRSGSYTLLAPTNDAFKALNQSKLASLLDPANKVELQRVLSYHVMLDVVTRGFDMNDHETLAGANLSFSLGATINGGNATVVSMDHIASNGVVMVIDSVLIPPPNTAAPTSSPAANPSFKKSSATATLSKVATTMVFLVSAAMAAILI
jgi:transforming growth factor-beta-induced protein